MNVNLSDIKELLDKHSNNKITIIDDIDFDGLASASIVFSILSKLNYNVSVIPNTQHGLINNPILNDINTDLLIIVDSGTNEIDLLVNKPYDVLIIDHHLKTVDFTDVNNLNTIINFNGKDYKSLYNFSAGMLTFYIFNSIYPNLIYSDLEILSYISYFTDMVDLDDFILQYLIDFETKFNIKDNSDYRVMGSSFNAVRKSAKPDIIKSLFYQIPFQFNNNKMVNNISTYRDNYKALLSFILSKAKNIVYELDNISFYDLTPFVPFTKGELSNTKGTIANMLSKKLITITGLLDSDIYNISFRCKCDTLPIVLSIQDKYQASFAGHSASFGGTIPLQNLTLFLQELSTLLIDIEANQSEEEISLSDKSMEEIAYLNSINNKGTTYYISILGKCLKNLEYVKNIDNNLINDNMIYKIIPERIVYNG